MNAPAIQAAPSAMDSWRHDSMFDSLWESAEQSDEFWTALAVTDFTSGINRLLRERNLSRARFAEKLGKKPSWVSRVLNGSENLSVKTMVQMARALGLRLKLSLWDEEAQVQSQVLYSTQWHFVVETAHHDYALLFGEPLVPRSSTLRWRAEYEVLSHWNLEANTSPGAVLWEDELNVRPILAGKSNNERMLLEGVRQSA